MEIVQRNTQAGRRILVFVYISLIIHFYVLLLLTVTVDKSFLDQLLNPTRAPQETMIENIVLETATAEEEVPLEGKISDKPNVGRGNVSPDEEYNYLNPQMGVKPTPPQTEQNEGGTMEPITPEGTTAHNEKPGTVKTKTENFPPGDYHTSYFDPERPADVRMSTQGDISLDTVPVEYADYLINISRTVSEQWRNFFPVFQYYSGMLRSGEVIVQFQVDGNGNVINPMVSKSYGYGIIDHSCLNAVEYSRNFGPMPDGLKPHAPINIHFKFVYVAK